MADAREAGFSRDRRIEIVGRVLAAYADQWVQVRQLALSPLEKAFLQGLYAGHWPTGNHVFDRVAVTLARELELLPKEQRKAESSE